MIKTEKDVKKLFDTHLTNLIAKHHSLEKEIDTWGKLRKKELDEYVNEQKALLKYEYEQKRNLIEDKRKEANDNVRQIGTKAINQTDTTIIGFQDSELEFVSFNVEKHKINLKEIIGECISREKVQHETGTPETKPTATISVTPSYNANTDYASSNASAAGARPATASQRPSRQNSALSTTNTAKDNTSEKLSNSCPVCYMIFPKTMDSVTRTQHTNSHYE